MASILVREHEYLGVGEAGKNRNFISNEQAEKLRKLEKTLPQGTLSWGHRCVKFSQYCGVINLGSDVIEILPKVFSSNSSPDSDRQIMIKMLYRAQNLILKNAASANIKLQKHHLLDIFIIQFCELLFEQIRQGIIKVYNEREENLNVVKGRLLVHQNIKYNSAHLEKVFCSYDELQEDNSYNRVIKSTLCILLGVSVNSRVKQKVTELLIIFAEVKDEKTTYLDIQKLPMNRIVSRYEPVLRMCEWFHRGYSPDISVGAAPAISLMFDMNRLFESFISSVLKKIVRRHGLKMLAQGPQKYLAENLSNSKNVFLMKPDITILDEDEKPLVIIDTKWKLLTNEDNKIGVAQSDMYQMLAYANHYNCHQVILIYPLDTDLGDLSTKFRTRVSNVVISVVNVDLRKLRSKKISEFEASLEEKLSHLLITEEL